MKNKRDTISSKLVKTRLLLRNRELAKHVPTTCRFSQSRLREMLERYGMLYLKPDTGSLGVGVMRVEKRGSTYRYQSGEKISSFPTFQAMLESIQRQTGSRSYLIQKGIHMLRHEGRPFDFRVMIQKNPSRRWEPTGTVARVAHPRKAVTNGSQGGTIYPAADLLKPIAGAGKTTVVLQRMNRLARLTAEQFSREHPEMNELGLDIALDRKLMPWILEVNTHPDPCPFTKLDNKASINKIVAYAKAYGRRYSLICSKAKKPKA